MGPFHRHGDEIDSGKPVHITVKVNGEVTQDDDTASMIFSFADLNRLRHDFHDHQAGRHHRGRHASQARAPAATRRIGSRPAISWKSPRRNWARCATPWSTEIR